MSCLSRSCAPLHSEQEKKSNSWCGANVTPSFSHAPRKMDHPAHPPRIRYRRNVSHCDPKDWKRSRLSPDLETRVVDSRNANASCDRSMNRLRLPSPVLTALDLKSSLPKMLSAWTSRALRIVSGGNVDSAAALVVLTPSKMAASSAVLC